MAAETVYLRHYQTGEVKTLTNPDPHKDLVPLMTEGFEQISEKDYSKIQADAEKAKAITEKKAEV